MKARYWILTAICGAAAVCLAQQSTSSTSSGSANAQVPPGAATTQDVASTEQTSVPDHNPLTGALRFTLGGSEATENLLVPRLHVMQIVDSESFVGTSQLGLGTVTIYGGGLTLNRTGTNRSLALSYNGGGVVYAQPDVENSMFHSLAISQSFSLRRLTLTFADTLNYTPETGLGGLYGGFGGFNVSSGNLVSQSIANQSVITGRNSSLGNTAVGQVSYALGPRTTWTVSGFYSSVTFFNSSFVDSRQLSARTGLSYQLSAKNSIGVNYGFSSLSSVGSAGATHAHDVQGSYGRKLTGRLAAQFSGGVQIYKPTDSLMSATKSWITSGNLQYTRGRTGFDVGFSRSVSGGSGVFAGATATLVTGGISRSVGRWWSLSGTGGFGRNEGLYAANNSHFHTVYGGAQLGRTVGRYSSINFSYNVQRQTGTGTCVSPGCVNDFTRHVFGIGFNWSWHPIQLGQW